MIYVSFPGDPDAYPTKATYNPEKSHHILYGLIQKYGNVTRVPFYQEPLNFNSERDVFVTELTGNFTSIPKNRIILVDNANFESNKWFYTDKARYTKHGVNNDNDIDGAHHFASTLTGIGNLLCLSNDIAIEKYKTNHPDIIEFKNYLNISVGNIDMSPHPLDKQRYLRFFDDSFIPSTPRMLIYHAGQRKNSLQFWKMAKEMGLKERVDQSLNFDYNQTPYFDKNNHNLLKEINSTYHMIVSCSYSETGPIHMHECMYQGLLVLGHEEWWNAYGYDKTLWTYDSDRYEEMKENLRWLMDPQNMEEIRQMRNHIININVNRKDNEWPHLLEKLYTMVDRLL